MNFMAKIKEEPTELQTCKQIFSFIIFLFIDRGKKKIKKSKERENPDAHSELSGFSFRKHFHFSGCYFLLFDVRQGNDIC